MPQIFHPSTNTFSKASIFGAVFFLAGIAGALALFSRSSYVSRVNVPINQPVQFSHEQHVSGVGLDCRYCHTSVDEAAFADIPPVHTCMTCHSQIWSDSPKLEPVRLSFSSGEPLVWNRVHDLADHVQFNHEIHVSQGVGCETCHGDVSRMPLMWKEETLYMEWCLECHRNPEQYIRPREAVYVMDYVPPERQEVLGRRLVAEYGIAPPTVLDDCSICHY